MRRGRQLASRLAGLSTAVALAAGAGGGGCAGVLPRPGWLGGEEATPASTRPYAPDRRDYISFREAHPNLLEPNFLPFMVHRFPGDDAAGDALIFCRWADEQMPIAVYVEPPSLGPDVQDEFHPRDPRDYAEAAAEGLRVWERELEGLVRFRRVERPEDAELRLRVLGQVAPVPVPGKQILGSVETLLDACRALGWASDADRMLIEFALTELRLYVADENGLLPTDVVRRMAIHELGHALGMRGHSPSPGDVMFPVLRNMRGPEQLSVQDVRSFLSLYRMPPGAHFSDVPPGAPPPRPPPAPPSGAPLLSVAPHVDARRGYELHVPARWLRIEEAHGLFSANGPSWDYDASLRIFVWPAPTVEHFLDCCSRGLLAGTWLRHRAWTVVKGRRALKLLVEDPTGQWAQEYQFVELDGERVMMIAAESPVEHEAAWAPWLRASVNSLEIWDEAGQHRSATPAESQSDERERH